MGIETYLSELLPELILLVGACVILLLGVTRAARQTSLVSVASFAIVLLALLATVMGGRPEITASLPGLLLTPLVYYTRLSALGVGALILLVNWHQATANERGEYMAMVLFSLLGILLTAAANDLLVLFLAIELVSVPTYVLIGLSRPERRAPEAAVKYFFLGAMAAALLAYGLSFLYGVAGTTTMHLVVDGSIRSNFALGADMGVYAVLALLFVFAGLAFKVAAVPFHVYAPDVYEGAAAPVTGLLGFFPKLAGFVALVKIFGALGWELPLSLQWMIWIVAAVTMTTGNVLALLQTNAKRMLAYSSIAHTGYMLIALLVGPVIGQGPLRDGVAALLFYVTIYGAMNLGAFALLSAFTVRGKPAETLDDLAGLARGAPLAALAFAVCVFSLMGFPPTAGFLGKLYVFSSAFSLDATHSFHDPLIVLAVIGVLNSVIGAGYYLKLIGAVYLSDKQADLVPTSGAPVRWGLALCGIAMVVLFVWPSGLVNKATANARVVLDGQPVATLTTTVAVAGSSLDDTDSVVAGSEP